mgnify:CR=1 FL=1
MQNFLMYKNLSKNTIAITITKIHSAIPARLMHKIPSRLCLLPEQEMPPSFFQIWIMKTIRILPITNPDNARNRYGIYRK